MADITTAGEQAHPHERVDEKAGIYLSALAAFLVPILITAAFFLSSSSTDREPEVVEAATSGTGLDPLEVRRPTMTSTASSSDAGTDPQVELAADASVAVEVAGTSVSNLGNAATEEDAPEDEEALAPAIDPDDQTTASATTAADEPVPTTAPGANSTEPTSPTTSIDAIGADETTPATAAPAPTTTDAPSPPTTLATLSASTAPTTAPSLPDAPTTPTPDNPTLLNEPPGFSQRIDVGRITDTSLAMRFMTSIDSRYTVIVRSGATLVKTESGQSSGGVLVNETVSGLTPGTDYTVHVVLAGTPQVVSRTVSFRTSGGEPEPAAVAVELLNPRVVDLQSTRFELNYESNICANGSFVIREQGGAIVGRNSGQAAGCTTRHLAIPGYWTAALTPNTTYVITVTVEANGAGQGGGNLASTSLTVTTSG